MMKKRSLWLTQWLFILTDIQWTVVSRKTAKESEPAMYVWKLQVLLQMWLQAVRLIVFNPLKFWLCISRGNNFYSWLKPMPRFITKINAKAKIKIQAYPSGSSRPNLMQKNRWRRSHVRLKRSLCICFADHRDTLLPMHIVNIKI